MPLTLDVEIPDANEVIIDPVWLESGAGNVRVRGIGNKVVMGRPLSFGYISLNVEAGSVVRVDEGCVFGNLHIFALASGCVISVGAKCAFNGHCLIAAHEKANITIGESCLFAPETTVSASDVHKIFDRESGLRINPADDIFIGNRVWVSGRAFILKGSNIGSDSVIGLSSVVNGSFPPNSLIAGSPATVRRAGIRWEY